VAESAQVGSEPIDIVLADDHAMVRTGLRLLLDAERDFRVVAEAGDIDTALQDTRAHRPRVIVLDLNMPGTPTVPAIPRFLEASPGAAVVVLTMTEDPAFAREAIAAGASGYVLKEAADGELVDAVRDAAQGRSYLNPRLGARLAAAVAAAGAEEELAVGSTFAGHRIEAVAGRGGMGVVYRATDLTLDRPVALKLIASRHARDPVYRARFERECRLAAAIDHPHVVAVLQAGEQDGRLYLTMRYVEGTDLHTLLRIEGSLDPPRAVALLRQVASGLDEAHARGLVHRDVKPGNVLIGRRSSAEHAFLTDFGVTTVREGGAHLTATGFAVGTADYIAPEQAQGAVVDARADIYSLGCVLFRTLTGVVPYDRTSELDKMLAHIHEPPPWLLDAAPELPPRLAEVLLRTLAKDPSVRPQTAGTFADEALAAIEF
jgi:DNA-binding NarL/FixJ family response regulator